jgi:hypothetical protein
MIRVLGILTLLLFPPPTVAGESWRMQQSNGHLIRAQTQVPEPALEDSESVPDQIQYSPAGSAFGSGTSDALRSFGVFELSNGGSICVRTRPGPGGCLVNFTRNEVYLVDRQSGRGFPVRMRFSLKP